MYFVWLDLVLLEVAELFVRLNARLQADGGDSVVSSCRHTRGSILSQVATPVARPRISVQSLLPLAARFFQSLCFLSLTSLGWAQTESTAYLIDTVAGSDRPLDAERAVDTWLVNPFEVTTDDDDNVYLSTANSRVLRIKPERKPLRHFPRWRVGLA